MRIIMTTAIFLLICSIGFIESKANAQEGELILTINPGATNSDSQNPIEPANITIPVGATVIWLNKDSSYHQIVSGTPDEGPSNIFYGDFFGTNEAYNVTFDNVGTVDYYDPIWNNIKGQIITVPENITGREANDITATNGDLFGGIDINNSNETSLTTETGQLTSDRDFQPYDTNTTNSENSIPLQSGITGENTITSISEQQPVQNQNQIPVHGTIDSFKASGLINSFIVTSSSSWNATGEWSMIVENGEMKNFITNMAWFNGTSGHTHDFLNFDSRGEIELPSDNILTIYGEMDVASNGEISWDSVESTIDIGGGGKTITISVDHEDTDHHFAGQPVVGTITSLTPCSDSPGADMEILPTCN